MGTKSERLQSELMAANALLRTVIDENPNIILMKDWDGKFLIGNRALAALYGTTPAQLVGKDDGAFNPNAEQVAFYLQNVREVMSQSETRVVMEASTNAETGEVSYYQSIKKPLVTADGKKQILVIANDVTELKRVQQQLEQSERRLRYVLDATGEGIWDWDIKTGLVTHNPQWCKIIGFDDPLLQHPVEIFADLLHPDDRATVLARLQRCQDGGERYRSEHRMRLPDGRTVWVLDRGDVVERDAQGGARRMVGSFIDISERKAAELALSARTELLNAIFELSPDGFVSFDETRRVSSVSPAFTQMTGIALAHIEGLDEHAFTQRMAQRCLPRGPFIGVERLRARAQSGQADERELIELTGDSRRILEVTLRLGQASSVSQILYFRDVTHETEVDHMKSEFLSTAAHELRTPMASIYGFAEVLLTQKTDDATQREFLDIIYRKAELMTSILNELLDLARIEGRQGKDFVFESLPAQALLYEVVSGFKLPTQRVAPVFSMPSAPVLIRADRKKAMQALLNVLSNAYKYSPAGSGVDIDLAIQTSTSPMAAIRITDRGIGMTPEQSRQVFERFYRADTSGKVLGTGLGMSIVKEIMDLHHGGVALQSALGRGTSVTLLFALATET